MAWAEVAHYTASKLTQSGRGFVSETEMNGYGGWGGKNERYLRTVKMPQSSEGTISIIMK